MTGMSLEKSFVRLLPDKGCSSKVAQLHVTWSFRSRASPFKLVDLVWVAGGGGSMFMSW